MTAVTDMPRIGFDALFLEQPMTGAGQYALNIWRHLRDRQDVYTPVLLQPGDAPDQAKVERGSRVSLVSPLSSRVHGKARKLWWEQYGLPIAARQADVSLVHIPYFSAPIRRAVPHVVTVHDVIPLAVPEYGGSAQMRAYMRLVGRTVKRAALILTDSEYSKGDIVRLLGIHPDRVRVTFLAAGDDLRPAQTEEERDSIEATRARYGLTNPFVLNVGGHDLRKRLPWLIRGFASALPSLPGTYDLVITGRPHTGNPALYPALEPLIRELGLEERVKLTGFVSEEDKRNLYRACDVFVFPSGYEGFGLDPLEAMACGAPVISSNRSSLPEVVGDAGLLIDPEPADIGNAIVAVLTNPDLRADLAARSLRRAALFSWERTAEQTLAAYRDVLERHPCAS